MERRLNLQKTTWQHYLKIAVLSATVFSIGFLGFQYYASQKAGKVEKASELYETMAMSIHNKDQAKAKADAQTLMQDYKNTPYAPLAALTLASIAIEKQDMEKGRDYLKEALNLTAADKGPIKHVARTRLAKVLASEGKYDEALLVLDAEKSKEGYVTLYEEIKGDIYLKQNKRVEAKEAFKNAKNAAPQGLPVSRLELKLADLGN